MPDTPSIPPEEEPYSLGGGVLPVIPRLEKEEVEKEKPQEIDREYKEEEEEGGRRVIRGRDGRVRWATLPPKTGMLQDTAMYRTGPPQCKLFVLPDDLEAYNSFLRRSGNTGVNLDGDPEMMLETNHEEFYQGKFYVRITYREIFYRQLFNEKEI